MEYAVKWVDGRSYGDDVSYSCKIGYDIVGSSQRKCDENGQWTGSHPFCELITCPVPLPLANGEIEVPDERLFGSWITYKCHEGWELVGDVKRECLADKTWSANDPKCDKPACPRPEIERGYITISAGGQHIERHVHALDRFVAGMVVSFDCERGYELTGAKEIECFHNRSWNADIPTCERVKCNDPGISNALLNAPRGMVFGRRVLVSCKVGYELRGKTEIFCKADGTWSDELPKCKLVSCWPPTVQGKPHLKIKIIEIPNIGVGYPYGIVVGFRCAHGYALRGHENTTCGADKRWSHDFPNCTMIVCPVPEIGHNNLRTVKKLGQYTLGQSLKFMCAAEYELVGSEKLTCGNESKWEGTVPTCVKKQCPKPDVPNGYLQDRRGKCCFAI